MKFVRVDKNQNVFTVTLENNDNITSQLLHFQLNNRKNKKDFKLLHTFEFDGESVELYGYTKGIEKNINKLELPQEVETQLFYDDLVLCAKDGEGNYVDFEREEFEDFYDSIFGGFEDLDESDGEFEQDKDYDYEDGFVINDL